MTGLKCIKMPKKKKIKRIVSRSLSMLLMISLSGCAGNSVSFDLGNQSILSCSGNDIVDFELKTDSQTYEFHIRKDVKSQNEIVVNEIMNNNSVVRSYPNSSDTMFVLNANSEYIFINRTVGDAAASKVTFSTDKNRRIVAASKVQCK